MEKNLPCRESRRIMLVDDDEDFSDVLSWALGQAGYETVSFKDPKEALLFLELDEDLALMVVDYHMEAMNGDEFLKLKHPVSQCPVMMITGSPEEISERIPPHFFQAVVPKPLDLEHLMEKVRGFMN